MRYSIVKQHDENDCGAACLSMVAKYYGVHKPLVEFRKIINTTGSGTSVFGMKKGAEMLHFQTKALEGNMEELLEAIKDGSVHFPFIAHIIIDNNLLHYVVVFGKDKKNRFLVGDPQGKKYKMSVGQFSEVWTGYLLDLIPNEKFEKKNENKHILRSYLSYLKGMEPMLFGLLLMSFFISIADIMGANVFSYIIDEIYLGGSDSENVAVSWYQMLFSKVFGTRLNGVDIFEKIAYLCGVIILFYVFQILLMILCQFVSAKAAKKIEQKINYAYYDRILKLPIRYINDMKTGELISRLYEISRIRESIMGISVTLCLNSIMAIMYGAFLYNMNGRLFSWGIIIVLAYMIVILLFKDKIRDIAYEAMSNEAQLTSLFKESVDGIETVKVYNYELRLIQKFKECFGIYSNTNVKYSVVSSFQGGIVTGVTSIGNVIILGIGILMVTQGIITLGTLMTFSVMLGYFFNPIQTLISLVFSLQSGIASAERLNDVMYIDAEEENEEIKRKERIEFNIELKNVDFRYGNGELVLHDVNMKIGRGEVIALMGASGCGKSTLAKLLLAFEPVERGEIYYGNDLVDNLSKKQLREHVVYVAQEVDIFSGSIAENIVMGNDNITEEEFMQACRMACVDEFVDELVMGYDTLLEEKGTNLSAGQLQRIALARALLKNPEILILDEATNKLDVILEKKIITTIKQYLKGKTIIMIAHRLSLVKACDYIYFMEKGQIVEQGTQETLINKHGRYEAFCQTE